jgi:hypothetical protein
VTVANLASAAAKQRTGLRFLKRWAETALNLEREGLVEEGVLHYRSYL